MLRANCKTTRTHATDVKQTHLALRPTEDNVRGRYPRSQRALRTKPPPQSQFRILHTTRSLAPCQAFGFTPAISPNARMSLAARTPNTSNGSDITHYGPYRMCRPRNNRYDLWTQAVDDLILWTPATDHGQDGQLREYPSNLPVVRPTRWSLDTAPTDEGHIIHGRYELPPLPMAATQTSLL